VHRPDRKIAQQRNLAEEIVIETAKLSVMK
jgi:hypothetical protein